MIQEKIISPILVAPNVTRRNQQVEPQHVNNLAAMRNTTSTSNNKANGGGGVSGPGDSGGTMTAGIDALRVGDRIEVYWTDDKKYYKGRVAEIQRTSGKHKVVYDDGDIEMLVLKDEKWRMEGTGVARRNSRHKMPAPPRKRVAPESTGSTQPSKRIAVNRDVVAPPAVVEEGGIDDNKPISRAEMVEILAGYQVQQQCRYQEMTKRIDDLEECIRTTNTELAALRGQFAALSAIITPQADAARNAAQTMLRDIARSILENVDSR